MAAADSETLGLVLSGSRAAGVADAESDYDLYWVLTDEVFERRREAGSELRERRVGDGGAVLDIVSSSPRELAGLRGGPSWRVSAFATARVLLDKTGEATAAVRALAVPSEEKARADAAGWFDAYLNAFYRSLKAWRRGDELGGRLHAAESAGHLVRTLFALEGRWAPYLDGLSGELDSLGGQGWPPGMLHAALLDLARTGDPARQQALEARVEALLRGRGYGHVLERWGCEIERVKGFTFVG